MVKCGKCEETAAPGCLMEPKLCGKCCQPHCTEGAHNQRHTARGKKGSQSKEQRWDRFWRAAHANTITFWRNAPMRRYMQQSGATFGYIRYQLLHTLHELLRDEPGTETELCVEAAVAMAPREREELLDSLKDLVGDDEVPPFPLETTLTSLTPDELADPEELEASWIPTGEPASSSAAASSSARPHLEEPATKRAATGTTAEKIVNAVSSLDLALMPPPRDPKGMPAYDVEQKECSHYRRRSPPLNVVSWCASMPPTLEDATSSYADAQVLLRNWLGLRPGLLESLDKNRSVPLSLVFRPGR